MIDLAIPALTVEDRKPFSNGDTHIATFTLQLAGIQVHGMRLVKTAAGGFRVVSPAVSRDSGREAIRFVDSRIAHQVAEASRELYRQKGGTRHLYGGQERNGQ